jgi:uncharacterized protein YndB with AHSA1/START domain
MLVKIGIAVVVVVVVLAAVIALQPSEFRVERSATIPAPPAAVFAQINDLQKWEAWSPWEKLDPAAKKTFSGPPAGVGASFTWAGNYEVGEGRVTITESRPNELVRIRLDMIKPVAASNLVEFSLTPVGEQTTVTWSMTGRNGFVSKAVGLVMDMDKMVGGQFEKGLAGLKSVAATKS